MDILPRRGNQRFPYAGILTMENMISLVREWKYTPCKVERGYAKQTLTVDIGKKDGNYGYEIRPVSREMIETFTGGRGFGLKMLWDMVGPDTKWNDPENALVISGGPLCGTTQYPGMGKCYTVFLSPLTGQTFNSNAGGYFGPLSKFSGFDAFAVTGKSDKGIIIFLDGDEGKIRIYESRLEDINSVTVSEQLTGYFATDEDDRRNVSVVSAGQGAQHGYWGVLNFSFYDVSRGIVRLKQAGRGGGGTVLRDKGIVALVVRKSGVNGMSNDPADLATLQRTGAKAHREVRANDDVQSAMRTLGTAHLNEIMNDYHLLPINNFKFGQKRPEIQEISLARYKKRFTQGMPDGCWYGCSLACAKAVDGYILKTGPWKGKKVTVDGPEYETAASVGSNVGIFDPEWTIEANFYADHYALDTISLGTGFAFVCECYELGLINSVHTNGLKLNFGAKSDLMELLHRMAEGKDRFALYVGKGIRKMKEAFSAEYGADIGIMEKIGMEGQGLEVSLYRCQESVAQWGGYFLALKGPQHDEAWVIFMDMVRKLFPTLEDKAEALFYFPNFRTWFSLAGVCKLPWNDIEPADNRIRYKGVEAAKVPEHVQNYIDVYNAVTGGSITGENMITGSEKVYNFERLFNLRLGHGTRKCHNIPDRALGPVFPDEWNARPEYFEDKLKEAGIDGSGLSIERKIEKLLAFRRSEWEKLVDAVFKRRGWDENGVPTLETVKRLGIDTPEIVGLIKEQGNIL